MTFHSTPLPTLVDSHCHLDLHQFDEDRDGVLERARTAGVRLIVIPGIDLESCGRALALAEEVAEIYVAVGVHPNSSGEVTLGTIAKVRTLAAHPKVIAIGEIGLDYYWKKVEPEQQARAFRWQLELAADLGLPVIIHNRDATQDVVNILDAWVHNEHARHSPLATRPFRGVLHAFGGDLELAQRVYGWNFVISLGGPVTFQNAHRLHTLAPQLDLERLMLETDAPYLTPHPHRGKRNEPAYTALVCEQLARLTGRSVAEVARTTSAVAYRFFGLEDLLVAENQHAHAASRA